MMRLGARPVQPKSGHSVPPAPGLKSTELTITEVVAVGRVIPFPDQDPESVSFYEAADRVCRLAAAISDGDVRTMCEALGFLDGDYRERVPDMLEAAAVMLSVDPAQLVSLRNRLRLARRRGETPNAIALVTGSVAL